MSKAVRWHASEDGLLLGRVQEGQGLQVFSPTHALAYGAFGHIGTCPQWGISLHLIWVGWDSLRPTGHCSRLLGPWEH